MCIRDRIRWSVNIVNLRRRLRRMITAPRSRLWFFLLARSREKDAEACGDRNKNALHKSSEGLVDSAMPDNGNFPWKYRGFRAARSFRTTNEPGHCRFQSHR